MDDEARDELERLRAHAANAAESLSDVILVIGFCRPTREELDALRRVEARMRAEAVAAAGAAAGAAGVPGTRNPSFGFYGCAPAGRRDELWAHAIACAAEKGVRPEKAAAWMDGRGGRHFWDSVPDDADPLREIAERLAGWITSQRGYTDHPDPARYAEPTAGAPATAA